MKVTFFPIVLLGTALSLVSQSSYRAQEGPKQEMKDAGHDTKNAVKHTGKAAKKSAKKATHKSAHQVRKGAGKVEEKTEPQP